MPVWVERSVCVYACIVLMSVVSDPAGSVLAWRQGSPSAQVGYKLESEVMGSEIIPPTSPLVIEDNILSHPIHSAPQQ